MEINLMACGHVANARDSEGRPACVICTCFDVAQTIDAETNPTAGLEGRMCRCADCGKEQPSRWTLPFFKYRPGRDTDSCYDGCYGWD